MIVDAGAGTAQEDLPLMFGMIMYEGDPEVVADTIAHMPPEVRPFIADVAAQAFAQHATRVYGTPTPPRSTD
jgi:hypothetical protein